MLQFNIPGCGNVEIDHVIFDYNGTIAFDGSLISGVAEGIRKYSDQVQFHVITADTFGFVKNELNGLNVMLTIISNNRQDEKKLDYLRSLGTEKTMCVGNGMNDRLMLEHARIGIGVVGHEGFAAKSLAASDIIINDILDLFGFFDVPQRLTATLRI